MIRFAKKEDARAIAPLILVILSDMELPFLQKYGKEKTLKILEEAITDPDYRYSYTRGIVAEWDDKIAGVAFGYTDEEEPTIDQSLATILKKYGIAESEQLFVDQETFPQEWYLDSISVSEEFRGRGIGSQLLSSLPKLAEKSGRTVIGLSVDEQNPKAKKLYESHGFKVVGKRKISGHFYDHMQKKI
ncbi:GNAT family N-acetyltransferase [Enterococcus ratti]|uniref:GNAT family acetyltransferase n=1 Tax=Enterococcus ratti TaxID=150033 RepID=A0A1L8WG96_9ENTE|nr:GNAT family N-acetyltransferase [Enterococcus ratti]OJG80059.1 GNAT family acetyltransferase [Enterococcus ratti]